MKKDNVESYKKKFERYHALKKYNKKRFYLLVGTTIIVSLDNFETWERSFFLIEHLLIAITGHLHTIISNKTSPILSFNFQFLG